MKRIIIVLLILSMLCLFGCTVFNNMYFEANKGATLAENFCFALSDDDLNAAQEYLHPDSLLRGDVLSSCLTDLEQNNSIDFSNGISFINRDIKKTYITPRDYENNLMGKHYILVFDILVDGKTIELSFDVLNNEKGFGIYSFENYVPNT